MANTLTTQGRLADAKLTAAKLVLTQGGEPTFVPHNTSAPEWNTAALGPEKLLYARRLARELASSLFNGGVVLQSFGKQYPGEPLPRWQVGVYRSRTAGAIWTDLNRLRLDQSVVKVAAPELPQKFIQQLARALGLQNTALPAYEDFEAKLRAAGSDAARRLLPRFSRSQRAFVSRPLTKSASKTWQTYLTPAGWVLPLDHDGKRWFTRKWKFPSGKDLTLFPGDSSVGLRLPLNCLPGGALRRALTVEVKDDELLVFLPPLPTFHAFSELTKVIERLAVKLGLPPLCLEGYPPPADEDLESIALTSDPGALEVNLPPVDNWPDHERLIRGLFASAKAVGMRGFKHQLNGRRVGTGGGAHILLGGPSLDRNPFIQRPTLLSSFLRFLQHHPSLSYVFSGLFTGPSCQAPRVDESVVGLPHELEITLRGLELMPQPGDPRMMDAMLRNVLMDWNGNTHRAELSVDKFYNLDASNGRQGIIEFRAFEMVSEPELLLAVNALLRALAACFAERPFTRPLIDWGDALHDRFALPWFLRQDLGRVITYVNQHGFSFAADTFEPQREFRFPVIARFDIGEVRWTLRQALEPWPVMGEHLGTGRVVDASTDRLELLAEGFKRRSNLAVSVNGVGMPLSPAGRGRAVGAIRYRLMDNPWGLQPQIKAHSPLRITIIDVTTRKSVFVLDYLNWKPRGKAYDGLPRSEGEARKRVAARVRVRNKLRNRKAAWRALPASPRTPFTLDLRAC